MVSLYSSGSNNGYNGFYDFIKKEDHFDDYFFYNHSIIPVQQVVWWVSLKKQSEKHKSLLLSIHMVAPVDLRLCIGPVDP